MLGRILPFLKKKKDKPAPAQAPVDPSAKEMITVYDGYGREFQISRQEWRSQVLTPNLALAKGKPDELYNLILSALNDGFAEDVQDAARTLASIDPDIERSHTILGIVLMKTAKIAEAEAILNTAIKQVGETGTLLTNLAKIYAERGDSARSEQTLWRAIELDPNLENGLLWWFAIERERGGEEGYLQAIKKASTLKGSWRPQLWHARHYLERKEVDSAKAIYQAVLDSGIHNSDALMMISGDLGNNNFAELIPEFIAPFYKPEQKDIRPGLNLLEAYLALGRIDEGEALLNRLYAQEIVGFKQHLDHYSTRYQTYRENNSEPIRIDSPEQLDIQTITLDRPIWMYGLGDPSWLFKSKPSDAKSISIISFSKLGNNAEQPEEQREDDIGRYTRAIPLYLAEAVHYWTEFRGVTLIPVVNNGGPIVFGSSGGEADLCETMGQGSEFLLTGDIDCSAPKWRVTIRLWHCATRACHFEESKEVDPKSLGVAVLQLEKALIAKLGTLGSPLDDFYLRPSEEAIEPYLSQLGQGFMQTLISNKVAPKDRMWGERNILEWPLKMALHWPAVDVPKIMYLAGLAKAARYQSDVLLEFKTRTLEFMKDGRQSNSVVSRLKPVVWKAFDMSEELLRHKESLPDETSEDYRQWLERIIAPDATEEPDGPTT